MARLADAMAILSQMWRRTRPAPQDLGIILGLLLLPLLFFWPVALGGKTLLPLDNLFASEPWKSYAEMYGVTVPHNMLVSDLILENYVWKRFIRQTLSAGSVPLWNPYLFAGVPFLAAGQHSALYPLSVLFCILPLTRAYGWFMVLQFFLTALFTYVFGRMIGLQRFGATIAAIAYTFSLSMVVSVVFPMIVAASGWLPLLLTVIECVIRRAMEPPHRSPVPYVLLGAVVLGCEWLAGHVEITYFILLVMALYAAWRLVSTGLRSQRLHGWRTATAHATRTALWLLFMVILGCGLAAIQIVPLYELVRTSFRQGSVTLEQVLGWAYPKRRLLAFLMPDFFGNPTHHGYFDIFSRQMVSVSHNYLGEEIHTIDWGIKNYVEGGSYVGILPLLLTFVAILGTLRHNVPAVQGGGPDHARHPERSEGPVPHRSHVWFFVALAILALSFAFGTPLYALIYHLPGLRQSHSPFRWIMPFVFSVSVLAGFGAQHLSDTARHRSFRWLGWLSMGGGVAILAGLGISLQFPTRVIPLAERIMLGLARAPEAFADGRMFFSYQFRNLAILGVLLVTSGMILLIRSLRWRLDRWELWKPLSVLVLVGDLFLLGRGFYPAADPHILELKPPVIGFLQSDPELFRLTVFDTRSTKPFPANEGMFFDLYDIRGYDSIIPRRYTEFMGFIEEQGELLYNRIARLRYPEALDSPLLDLLNVKYVLTEETIERSGYTLVYDGEVKVYRNDDYLPRAFLVYQAQVAPDERTLFEMLRHFNPRQVALFEEPIPPIGPPPAGQVPAEATIMAYSPNEVKIEASLPVTGVLVMGDSHFPDWSRTFHGWRAYDTAEGATEEQEIHIYRVDGNFRGLILGPGKHSVRMRYTPMSVKFGLFVSFVSLMVLALLGGAWAWRRYYTEEVGAHPLRRIAKNTGSSILLTLMNRAVDMAFAMFMLRVLGPEDAGKYAFAVVVVTWFEIVTNFGLNTLLTRDVARDQAHANRYLANTSVIRLALSGLALPVAFAFIAFWRGLFGLPSDTGLAIVLLVVGLVPSGLSTGLSALFNAYEKMEYPAAISTLTTILKVIGGTLALLLGFGFVGLAGVSIVVNVITLGILLAAMARHFFRPRWELDFGLQKRLLAESWPLMLNHLLATLFFKLDLTLLQAIAGDRIVGYYSTAYKLIDALTILPSYFTVAVFPILSRYATTARDTLRQAYLLALKFLLLLALPIMVSVFFAARPLIRLLGGEAYLPDSMIALQLLIGFLPFSFINALTHYVLLALDQQRFLTRAFAIGVGFNLVANLLFIPRFGYRASAVITVLSEVVLLAPFYYGVRRHLGALPWPTLAWRPASAAGAMALILVALRGQSLLWSLPLALMAYAGILLLLGAFSEEDRTWLRALREKG